VNQDFIPEELISRSMGSMKSVLIFIPTLMGGFATAVIIQGYLLHERSFPPGMLLYAMGMLFVFGGASFFVMSRLVDQAYAQVGVLSLRKRRSLIQVPYADIQKMGVFRGRYGPIAWVRMRKPIGHGRLFFFAIRNDYAATWPCHTATRFLWKLVNKDSDESV
jgi:hypothetical protein